MSGTNSDLNDIDDDRGEDEWNARAASAKRPRAESSPAASPPGGDSGGADLTPGEAAHILSLTPLTATAGSASAADAVLPVGAGAPLFASPGPAFQPAQATHAPEAQLLLGLAGGAPDPPPRYSPVRTCSRCLVVIPVGGPLHACGLPPFVTKATRAMFDGLCACCVDKKIVGGVRNTFSFVSQAVPGTPIVEWPDLGFVTVECAKRMCATARRSGGEDPAARRARLDSLVVHVPASVRSSIIARYENDAIVTILNAAPGSGKTYEVGVTARFEEPDYVALVFNNPAAIAMKKRGASRAATINGYGHRKNTKAVKDLLYRNRKRWNTTQVPARRPPAVRI